MPTTRTLALKLILAALVFTQLMRGRCHAQVVPAASAAEVVPSAAPAKKPWYEHISLRGYAQVRYNRLLETNDKFRIDQDKSVGDNSGLLLRRARLVVSGQVHPRVFIYLQGDFAGVTGSTNNVVQLRDCYADLGLDKDNRFRARIGISKVPFGFENMQSSQQRLPLDRSEALNTATPGERDLGVHLMWAPKAKRELFKKLVDDGLKGSGDYGIVALGFYNGQGLNKSEANDVMHFVGRVTWPFEIGSQVIEAGIMGYSGEYVVTSDQRSANIKGASDFAYDDSRIGGSLVLYPKPVGVLAEYNIGTGPEYNSLTDSIETKDLSGGFVTICYRLKVKNQAILPFVRYQVYSGGAKAQLDARHLDVSDIDAGIEWQPIKNFELTASYYIGDRTTSDLTKEDNKQLSDFLRLQAQFNF